MAPGLEYMHAQKLSRLADAVQQLITLSVALHACLTGEVFWQLGRLQRDERVSSDEQHAIQHEIQAMTDKHIGEVDGIIKVRSKELTSP